jgi:hypothetical protein
MSADPNQMQARPPNPGPEPTPVGAIPPAEGLLVACSNCRFWNNSVHLADDDNTGRCTIRAPLPDWRSGIGLWPYTSAEDDCGEFASLQPATAAAMPALRAAIAPFLRAAQALAANGQQDDDDLIFLDVNDEHGHPVSITAEEFVALDVAFMQMDP